MFLIHKAKSECSFGNMFFADSLFCGLTAENLESLSEIKQKRRFRKDAVILASGDSPCCIYILVKGRARLFLNIEFNNRYMIRSVEPNEIFGLAETIANLPYKMNLKTTTPCVFETIPCRDFIHFLHDEPEVCFRLVRLLGLNLQKSYQLFCSSII